MASLRSILGLVYVTAIFVFPAFAASRNAKSYAPSPAPSMNCDSAIGLISGCLSYVMTGSLEKKPSKECCKGLKVVVTTQTQCLCEQLSNMGQLGGTVNVTKALTLPDACKIKFSQEICKGAKNGSPPMAAPALSPFSYSPGGSPSSVVNAPASAPSQSDSEVLRISLVSLLILIASSVAASLPSF